MNEGRKKKGFTLAELLIVVAIIAVLVAISLPIFTSQLEKSRRAVDLSNARNMKSILMHSYTDGTIQFPGATSTVDGNDVNNYVAIIVTQDDVYYRASGEVKINGRSYRKDDPSHPSHDGSFQRVKDLFASAGFDNMHVHAKSTEDDGWSSYAVILRADGTCRIVSSIEKIDLGDGTGGTFESALERLLANSETNIEKAMGRES